MDSLKQRLKNTAMLRAFAFMKIPLIWSLSPSVIELGEDKTVVQINLSRKTKNHLGSMYFGALGVGADVAGGLIAWEMIQKSGKKISLVFKSFKAEFTKRPDADVYFVCSYGNEIKEFVKKVSNSSERMNLSVPLHAEIRTKNGVEKVANFEIELSLKAKN